MDLFVNADYNFLTVRRTAYVISGVLILVGLVSLVLHGGPNYSIDFEGGLMMRVAFTEPVDIGELRSVTAEATGGNPEVTRDVGEEGNYIIRMERLEQAEVEAAARQITDILEAGFPGNEVVVRSVGEVGPKVGRELRTKTIWAVFWALLGILIYISWRFEFRFAVVSVATLTHDVLMVLGLFSLINIEISLPIVAAVLTIIGYSLNDTIVVLDRIREDLKRYRQEKFDWIINKAINETLSRTVVTSVTTFLVVTILWLIGGPVIHDFAFALMAGVLIGTYSSIFVASPLLVEWNLRSPQVRTKKK